MAFAHPREFGGPGDRWSPETLLTGAVADCLALTFRALARARQLQWTSLEVEVQGTLDRVEGVTRFTSFDVTARLTIPPDSDPDVAERMVERADATCLVTRSLAADFRLRIDVVVEEGAERSAA